MPNKWTDGLIADAKNLPDLINSAKLLDPEMAKSLTGKSLVASKSVWGPVTSAAISWLVTHYGLGWDPDTCAEISGAIILVVSATIRFVTSGRITSVLPVPKTPTT